MRITSKGQVTVPAHFREKMGLLPETDVEFAVVGGNLVLRKAAHLKGRRGRLVIEALRGKATVRMTTDQIMALTRGE